MKNPILSEFVYVCGRKFRSYDDVILAAFDCVDEMFRRGLEIPFNWGYNPGADGPEDSEGSSVEFALKDATNEELSHAAKVLVRYTDKLKAAGKGN